LSPAYNGKEAADGIIDIDKVCFILLSKRREICTVAAER
jgi:hypothetical protein